MAESLNVYGPYLWLEMHCWTWIQFCSPVGLIIAAIKMDLWRVLVTESLSRIYLYSDRMSAIQCCQLKISLLLTEFLGVYLYCLRLLLIRCRSRNNFHKGVTPRIQNKEARENDLLQQSTQQTSYKATPHRHTPTLLNASVHCAPTDKSCSTTQVVHEWPARSTISIHSPCCTSIARPRASFMMCMRPTSCGPHEHTVTCVRSVSYYLCDVGFLGPPMDQAYGKKNASVTFVHGRSIFIQR